MDNAFRSHLRHLLGNSPSAVDIDNRFCRLHYRLTVFVMLMVITIVSSNQFFGSPILCMFDSLPSKVVETYCWVQPTYTVNAPFRDGHASRVGLDVAHAGVGPYVQGGGDEVTYHAYYYWVGIVLTFQAAFFYVPRYLWKTFEQGRLSVIANGMQFHVFDTSKIDVRARDAVASHMVANIRSYNAYAWGFFICESLNLVNVLAQIYLINAFLGGQFTMYGMKMLQLIDIDPVNRSDAMDRVFPKVTKCAFQKYGPSGSLQTFDGMCLLPLNIFNEKAYVVLWVWLMVLAGIGIFHAAYRALTLCVPCVRRLVLKFRMDVKGRRDVDAVFENCRIGSWFVLCQLSANIQANVFAEIIKEMAVQIRNKHTV